MHAISTRRWILCAAALGAVGFGCSRAERPAEASFAIPYRLTPTKHVMVRVKVNGQGPYNLIIDTGAPAVIFAKKLLTALDITPDASGWTTLNQLDIEGGLKLEKVTARFEDLYQLEGMNGLGLAGAEIHGLIGYPVLARYRIEYDLNKPKLTWTAVAEAPAELPRRAGRGGASGGLNALGSVMKNFGKLLGAGPAAPPEPRGFFGLTLREGDSKLVVDSVLPASPADTAGLRAGDVVTAINDTAGPSLTAALRLLNALKPGGRAKLDVGRGGEKVVVEFEAGRGF